MRQNGHQVELYDDPDQRNSTTVTLLNPGFLYHGKQPAHCLHSPHRAMAIVIIAESTIMRMEVVPERQIQALVCCIVQNLLDAGRASANNIIYDTCCHALQDL